MPSKDAFTKNPMAGLSAVQQRRLRLKLINKLLFNTPGGLRFTQDSPILPNVWTAFAMEPQSQQELILTVSQNGGTGRTAAELRQMLKWLRKRRPKVGDKARARARVSYIPGQLAVKLYFDELMRIVLPLTPWWHKTYDALRKIQHENREEENKKYKADWQPFPQPDRDKHREKDLVEALMLMRREVDPTNFGLKSKLDKETDRAVTDRCVDSIPADLSWLIRIAGLVGDCFESGGQLLEDAKCVSTRLWREFELQPNHDRIETSQRKQEREEGEGIVFDIDEIRKTRMAIVEKFVSIYENWSENDKYPTRDHRLIWRITKNRPVQLAVSKSALTVKADAAIRLFDISCRDITWAVLDSGIDRNHPAFKLTSEDHEREKRNKQKLEATQAGNRKDDGSKLAVDKLDNRIKLTLDFTRLRELLDFDLDLESGDADEETIARQTRVKEEIRRRMALNDEEREARSIDGMPPEEHLFAELRRRIGEGKDISWQDLEHAIIDRTPEVPLNDHGTHVAGILAADWIENYKHELTLPLSQRTRRMRGVCPDINLIDVRVFRDDGLTDEFELLAAIQFLRWMNSRAGNMQVHGANLSLSLVHDVHKFACGQTPICDECNEASALGMVIVAAAGNRGFEMENFEEVMSTDGYRDVTITDPGNAHQVITVGATHRKRPHEYGVSYFSSRGPTGDGRLKPDLVAPGEKIKGPTPRGRSEYKDGTSMAAPHVSGVAAMLMARHSELIGQPARIKKILCETATDLGRERYFQGHGLVDALRALQSV